MKPEEHSPLRLLAPPDEQMLGSSPDWFLHQLGQASWITQPGLDTSRNRVVSTLLHGNEPSGFCAVWRWFKTGETPAGTTHFFLGAVKTALAEPGFFYRQLPDQRDQNRCFNGPFDDEPGQIAKAMLKQLSACQPEAMVDLHNTSGTGPAFTVTIEDTPSHRALTSLFAERMLHTEVRLGALMELTTPQCPILTVECGGAMDPRSEQVAYDGLEQYLLRRDVLHEPQSDWALEVLRQPMRICLNKDASIAYADHPVGQVDLTLPCTIEKLNFGLVPAGTRIGWLGPQGLDAIEVLDGHGRCHTDRLFQHREDELVLRQAAHLFMITSNPQIAISDCLFYAAFEQPELQSKESA